MNNEDLQKLKDAKNRIACYIDPREAPHDDLELVLSSIPKLIARIDELDTPFCVKCGSTEICGETERQAAGAMDNERLEDAYSAMLWLYRRLPRAYGSIPTINQVIKMTARALGNDATAFLAERGESAHPCDKGCQLNVTGDPQNDCSECQMSTAAAEPVQEPPSQQPTKQQIELAAREIYKTFPVDGKGGPESHPWVEGGNSLKQDKARRIARHALDAAMSAAPLNKAGSEATE